MRTDLKLTPWTITQTGAGWVDDFCESIYFLGNGRMGVRGYPSSEPQSRPIQKGIYTAGVFGEIKPGITDFVNLPTPVSEKLYIDNVEAELASDVERMLNLREASLLMRYTLQAGGKKLLVESRRFLPKEHPALLMQELAVIPEEDMTITVATGILTDSCNSPIPDDQTKANTETIQLSRLVSASASEQGIACSFQILGTGLSVKEEVCVRTADFTFSHSENTVNFYQTSARKGNGYTIQKAACILTSRDVDPRIGGWNEDWDFETLLREHRAAWDAAWETCDLDLPSFDEELLCGLHFSMFHLMGSCSGKDPTVSIGARGLSHGRYKGCYFWDTDMFMLPFFLENDLEAARNLCDYRVRSLPAAKKHSELMNTAGARYPWMAALDGSEQCETWDIGCSELHVTADVAFALGSYCQKSGDEAFYLDRAAAVFVETARFWLSRYTYRAETAEADLLFCKGPDEYCGITNNNLFTNVMVQHNLDLAIQAAEDLKKKRPERYAELNITREEIDRMTALRKAIKWPHDPVTGRLTQDETLHLLEDVDISAIKPDAGASYHRVSFDRLQRYKVIKQADVLLLMTRMPHLFTEKEKQEAWEDFEPICLHDSTLSFASHALFALQNGITEKGFAYLRKALLLDLRDVMGNTGHEGLHLACMGEAWQAVFTGHL